MTVMFETKKLKDAFLRGKNWMRLEDDVDAPWETYTNPEWNDYLTLMEKRGWSLVTMVLVPSPNDVIVATFHRPEE